MAANSRTSALADQLIAAIAKPSKKAGIYIFRLLLWTNTDYLPGCPTLKSTQAPCRGSSEVPELWTYRPIRRREAAGGFTREVPGSQQRRACGCPSEPPGRAERTPVVVVPRDFVPPSAAIGSPGPVLDTGQARRPEAPGAGETVVLDRPGSLGVRVL